MMEYWFEKTIAPVLQRSITPDLKDD